MINFEAQSLSALEIWSLKFSLFTNSTKKCPNTFKELLLDTDLSDVTLATEDSGYCNGGAHHFLNISATGVLIYGELNNKNV